MKQSDGERCPHCGSMDGAIVNEKAIGWVVRTVEWNGQTLDTNFDKLRETTPAMARCLSCNRPVVNPLR